MKNSRLVIVALMVSASTLWAQDEISEVTFDTIPSQVTLESGVIQLQGDTSVMGDVSVSGSIELTAGGIRFPDGTVQSTAFNGQDGSGLYGNTIVEITPPAAFTEVCFKNGSVVTDSHSVSESTAGGNCLPGDLGWVIEQDERSAETWASARVECLLHGMRLPEIFEWHYSCTSAAVFNLNGMTDSWEWASNSTEVLTSSRTGEGVTIAGDGSCLDSYWGWVSNTDGDNHMYTFRCVR